MEVYTSKKGQKTETIGQLGAIDRIVALGNVTIKQAGRTATAGKGEIFPIEGKIILTENPVVIDEDGEIKGDKMTLLKGKRQAIIEGKPNQPVRIKLPTIKDLGFTEETE